MAITKKKKVHGIIHTASAGAGGIGAGLAQFPQADNIPLTTLQVSMISAIAMVHGRKLTHAAAVSILGTLTATMFGRAISQWLVGWIPGWGNSINAFTAASLTEGIGWAAHAFFEDLGQEQISDEEIKNRMIEFKKSSK